jgi:DnaJ-class molecular chaperone
VLDSEWGGENGPSAGTDALEERWERLCEHCGTWNNGDMRPEDIFAFFDAEKKEAVAAVERQHADQMAHASESFLEQLTAQKERIRAEARLEGHDEACRDCGIENGVLAECPLRTSLRLNVERATSKPVCKTCGGQGRVEAPNAQFHDPCPDCAAPEPRQEKERK